SSSWSSICSQSPHSPHHSHFFFPRYSALRYLHSFPTRRSSDLGRRLLSMPELHDQIPTREKVLIIGAGPAGLAAAASLKALEVRSEEHTSELQSRENLVCRLLLEKKNKRLTQGSYH